MTQNPNTHEWTGTTVQEAVNLLRAASDLLQAHMKALAPGDSYERSLLSDTTPVTVKVSIDLTELATSVSAAQELKASLHQTD